MKDPDHLIKVEKAIQEKYGDEAIQNPKANWDPEKEKDFLKKVKETDFELIFESGLTKYIQNICHNNNNKI